MASLRAMASSATASLAASPLVGSLFATASPTAPPAAVEPTAERVAGAATAAVAADFEPYDLESAWIPDLEADAGPYSIRVPDPSGNTRCARCRSRFLASGPTGFAGEVPICDVCLLEGSKPLGMVIALTAVARTFAAVGPGSQEEREQATEELASFARIYDQVAAKTGPRRPFRLPESADRH